jgi:hypothetical protein
MMIMAMWCAYGTTATQLAEKFANQAVASMAQTSKQTLLDRLRKQRDALTFTETSAEGVKTAEAAVATATEQAAAERARGGCKDLCRQREAEERAAREALLRAQQNHAATVKATDLDGKIAAAEDALNKIDVTAATMEADPQSASMAKAIDADQNLIAAISHAFFALSIELGSGVGFWLIFGMVRPAVGGRKSSWQHRTPWFPSIAAEPSISRSSMTNPQRSSSVSSSRSCARGATVESSPWRSGRLTEHGASNVATARCPTPCLAGWRAGERIGSAAPSGTWMLNSPRATPA